jgi:hypothetical protein
MSNASLLFPCLFPPALTNRNPRIVRAKREESATILHLDTGGIKCVSALPRQLANNCQKLTELDPRTLCPAPNGTSSESKTERYTPSNYASIPTINI